MIFYSAEESYLADSPLYSESYKEIINQINEHYHTHLKRIFVFELVSGMRTLVSVGGMPKTKVPAAIDETFWLKYHTDRIDNFTSSHSVKELHCYVCLNKTKRWMKLSSFLGYEGNTRKIPSAIIEYESCVIKNEISRKQNSSFTKPNISGRQERLARYFGEQLSTAEPQLIYSSSNSLQDDFGFTRAIIESVLVHTRDLGRYYINVKDFICPDNMAALPCKKINKSHPLFLSITDRHYCLYNTIGSGIYEDCIPIPIEKYPSIGNIKSFAKRNYYLLTESEVRTFVDGALF